MKLFVFHNNSKSFAMLINYSLVGVVKQTKIMAISIGVDFLEIIAYHSTYKLLLAI